MKLTLVTLVLVAAVAASPYPWAAPQASADPSKPTKVNRTRKNPHREPTPVFKGPCNCVKPIVPMNLLSANEKCLMEHSAALGCYIASRGGCPSPAPACGMGVINTIPFAQ